ncbi:MAG TPA: HAMP domain-containing sensor histidine kinase, partial [Longimicrobiaceae bacterium]|nr:HAMP domain-containing sensor histidine kinase [Longimicrobiaceae bacterium]
ALFVGSVLLLLFNPRSRGVRWWVLFQAANLVWLGLQGWAFAAGAWPSLGRLIAATVQMLPALFMAYVLVEGYDRPVRDALLVIALGVAVLPVTVQLYRFDSAGWLITAWHVGMWGTATFLLLRSRKMRAIEGQRERRLGRAVMGLLVVVAPIVLAGAMLFGMKMFYYAMPLLVVYIQFLIFVGVARLQFYDIEVRAARTGEIAVAVAETERLAVVGELTASLAHEIRNPLTGVRSLAQRLAEEEIDERRRRRYAGVILEEVGRVERLVSNLLGLARRAPAPRRESETELDSLFDDLLLLLSARAVKAGVRLTADAGRIVAPAPREELAQVLLNLLLNALQYSPHGGAVHLLAGEAGGAVELLVRDSGPGVPPEERERIWEPFHSGSGGTGLGLAVVRRLAREQGWSAAVGDAPEGGAEFRLRIPRREDAVRTPAPPPPAMVVYTR